MSWINAASGPCLRLQPRGELDARSNQIRGKGNVDSGQWGLAPLLDRQQDRAKPLVHASLVRQAAPQVASEDEAAAWLAQTDRFPVPDLCARSPTGHSGWQEGRLHPAE